MRVDPFPDTYIRSGYEWFDENQDLHLEFNEPTDGKYIRESRAQGMFWRGAGLGFTYGCLCCWAVVAHWFWDYWPELRHWLIG